MHTVLKTYAVAGQVSREEFAQVMFRDVEKLAGRFVANLEKWGDDEQFPKAVYEMVFPGIEKMPIRNAFPYFKSFLSCTDGIVSVDFVLRDMKPVMQMCIRDSCPFPCRRRQPPRHRPAPPISRCKSPYP